MINWAKGYSAQFYLQVVDPSTWRDVGTVDITDGSIKREPTGQRESADVGCVNYHIPVEQWVRIYMDVRQAGGDAEHVPLFTGLATSPEDTVKSASVINKIECYSVLKPAADVFLQVGWYAVAGRRGGDVIADLLSVSPAPVYVQADSPTLTETIIAEEGETNLSMVDRILDAMNWRMRIDGDGTINIIPKPVDTVAVLDPISNDVIESSSTIVKTPTYACPNVLMAESGSAVGIARDDDPLSPLSTVSRGREVWARESGVTLIGGESINEYASRRLMELQNVQKSASYTRRYIPSVFPGDLIEIHYPQESLKGTYKIESQTVTLGYNAKTSEDVVTDVRVEAEREREVAVFYLVDNGRNNIVTADGDRIIFIA